MPIEELNGIELYYESHGDGPPIVFLHGAGGNHISWWQQVPHFRERYRCITIDHRGFGRSTDPAQEASASHFADDLETLLERLGVERTALVAQSMGGWSCLGVALCAPERVAALVMADTVGGVSNDVIDAARTSGRERVEREGLASLAVSPRLAERRPHLACLYEENGALNQDRGDDYRARFVVLRVKPGELAGLKPPSLWVVGAEDPLTPPAAIEEGQRLAPGSKYWEIAETGHSVYFERAPELNERVGAFLRECGW